MSAHGPVHHTVPAKPGRLVRSESALDDGRAVEAVCRRLGQRVGGTQTRADAVDGGRGRAEVEADKARRGCIIAAVALRQLVAIAAVWAACVGCGFGLLPCATMAGHLLIGLGHDVPVGRGGRQHAARKRQYRCQGKQQCQHYPGERAAAVWLA